MTSGLFARPWATVLDAEPGLEVVGLAADGDEAVEFGVPAPSPTRS